MELRDKPGLGGPADEPVVDAAEAPVRLRCEAHVDPLGIDAATPRLSWSMRAGHRSARQIAYQVLVASDAARLDRDEGDQWDSGRVDTDETIHVPYAGRSLLSRQRCLWKVRTWDDRGQCSPWSASATWEMALLSRSDWHAAWISLPNFDEAPVRRPSPLLRASFTVAGTVDRARLYATALGLYRASCNGQRIGNDHLTPGWTDYHSRLQYQIYDVGEMIRPGENVLGMELGDGWYRGTIGHLGQTNSYGSVTAAMLQLEIDFANGSRQVVSSDGTWQGAFGPVIGSDLLMGETFDARCTIEGWDTPGFDHGEWSPVVELTDVSVGHLVAQRGPTVQVIAEFAATSRTQPRPGAWVFDLGQNLVGWARLRAEGPAGTLVRLRFGEVLRPDGTLYTDNLGTARCTDEYILRGGGAEVFEPRFAYRGFRFVEVTGYPGIPPLDSVTGVAAQSNTQLTGTFHCSDELVNRLQHNILWSQRGNFVEVPTDCPQRDERLGWMGDAQMFAPTAAYNMDVEAFYAKWMDDVADAQTDDGAFPDVAPRQVQLNPGAPGWGDAGVIVPWTMYRHYGDIRGLEHHFHGMTKWVDWIHAANPDLVWREQVGQNFGDWDALTDDTPKDLVATAYFARSARLTAQAAQVLERDDAARRYGILADAIAGTFADTFIDDDGSVAGDTQTAYALALQFALVPDDKRAAVQRRLRTTVERAKSHVTTGFVGTGLLLPALTEAGHLDAAYELLTQDTFPSWGYEIARGATTIWERWDTWTDEAGFVDPDVGGSFNHFALGTVGEWLYANVGGIGLGDGPAFRDIAIRPRPGGRLTWAAATLDTPRGTVATHWSQRDGRFHLTVTIPANTTAEVRLPALPASSVTEGGRSLLQSPGVRFIERTANEAVLSIGSGTYDFDVGHHPG